MSRKHCFFFSSFFCHSNKDTPKKSYICALVLYASFRLGCLNGFSCVMKCSEKIHTYSVPCSILSNKNGQKIEKFHGCANIVCRLAHLRRYGSSLQPTTVASEPADWTNRSTVCCGRELLYFRVNVIEKKKMKIFFVL